jgi:hypothetical protein
LAATLAESLNMGSKNCKLLHASGKDLKETISPFPANQWDARTFWVDETGWTKIQELFGTKSET